MADFKDYATPEQLAAVTHRGHDILVSASAGSGKTKVLVERIKEEIINEKADISRMLIMTFTNAAAKEMKERLVKILQSELDHQLAASSPNSELVERLQRQLTLINSADISTIDSFCLRFLKKYYYALNLDPNFRVLADESERDVIREDVWEKVREDFYQTYENLNKKEHLNATQQKLKDSYCDLLQIFAQDRKDDALTTLVYRLNDFASANAMPDQWLANAATNYEFHDDTFTQSSIWQKELKQSITAVLQDSLNNYQLYLKKFKTVQVPLMEGFYEEKQKKSSVLEAKVVNESHRIQNICDQLKQILMQINDPQTSWDDIWHQYHEIEQNVNERLSRNQNFVKNSDFAPDDVVYDQVTMIKSYRENAKQTFNTLTAYFTYNDIQLKDIFQSAHGVVELIVKLVQNFRQRYLATKLRRHALEFSDLEYFTLQILQGKSKIQKKIQQELRLHYTEIMLDEYQDTNGIQEAIIQALAHNNLFMVGDVKQSIYRFRQADPHLFMHKYETFKTSAETHDLNKGELIVLQDNFRSVKNIAALTNLIFMQIMDKVVGELNYDQYAFLNAANSAYDDPNLKLNDVPVDVLLYLEGNKKERSDDEDHSFTLSGKTEAQFVMIAHKIKELLTQGMQIYDRDKGEMRPLTPADIVILSSSHQDSILVSEIFKHLGVPVDVDEINHYFKTTEIQLMISYLKVIDNPHQDIPLVAVLRSPMYDFDENELTYLRLNHPHGDFYNALANYPTKYENTINKIEDAPHLSEYDSSKQAKLYHKVKCFMDDLTTFRVQAKRSEIASLIWNIYTTTGFLDFVGGLVGGAQRQANLHALYERATAYEKTSFKGLFQFIRFIERMDKQQKDLPEIKLQVDKQAVQFMTIHKSKGLEYPIVFIMDLSKGFNTKDTMGNYVLDEQLGIGLNIVEPLTKTLKRDLNITSLSADDAVDVAEITPVNLAIKDQLCRKSLAEEMRKLYVAITRAEQQVYLVGCYDDLKKWATQWGSVNNEKEVVLPENQRLKAHNFMDWIGPALGRVPNLNQKTILYELDDHKIKHHLLTNKELDWGHYFDDAAIPSKVKQIPLNLRIELWRRNAITALTTQIEGQQKLTLTKLFNKVQGQPLDPLIKGVLDFNYPYFDLTKEPAYEAVTEIKHLFDDPDNEEMLTVDPKELTINTQKKVPVTYAFSKPNFITTEVIASPAKIGTATHLIFQKLTLTSNIDRQTVITQLGQLVLEGSVTPEVATKLKDDDIITGIVDFYHTALGKRIIANASDVKREVPFSLLLPVAPQVDKQVLVHGVIDGYFIDHLNDEVYLFDYKTDNSSLNKIKQEYQGQLNLYEEALASITHKRVIHRYLYALKHHQVIEL